MQNLDDALTDLARAVIGDDPELYWSYDEAIARRESAPLFSRCAAGAVSPDKALLVFLLSMKSKRDNSLRVVAERIDRVILNLGIAEQKRSPALAEFTEFFHQVQSDAMYVQSIEITRQELLPLFEACSSGDLSERDAQDAIFDIVTAKREVSMQFLADITQRLIGQIMAARQGYRTCTEGQSDHDEA